MITVDEQTKKGGLGGRETSEAQTFEARELGVLEDPPHDMRGGAGHFEGAKTTPDGMLDDPRELGLFDVRDCHVRPHQRGRMRVELIELRERAAVTVEGERRLLDHAGARFELCAVGSEEGFAVLLPKRARATLPRPLFRVFGLADGSAFELNELPLRIAVSEKPVGKDLAKLEIDRCFFDPSMPLGSLVFNRAHDGDVSSSP